MKLKRILVSALAVLLVISMLPVGVFAADVDFTESSDGYYKVISKDDYDIAPGITESEIVLNNVDGTRRQVLHVMEADVTNEYVSVIPSSKGMVPTPGQYGVQIMSEQAAWAEANGYGNVVGAMNISLSWYDSDYYDAHPELVGEPLGYLVLNGQYFENSKGKTSGAQTCLVINFDEKDGEARPADLPKTQIRSTSDPITGWEEQVIPANFGFLVKNGENVVKTESHTAGASRSMLGIKADGTIVMVMNDGRQSPYSEGLNDYEMGEVMLSLGCVYAINGDGGGSSTFLSQRPGEELELHCSPSDGAERPTTHGVLVISSAPATGEFVRANISSANDYYTPNSVVAFNAIGTDLVGTAADIPENVIWQLADDSFGTIDQNGVFTSDGKVGEVTVQMVYNDAVVGSDTIYVVYPDTISLGQATITAPYGRDIQLVVTALYDNKNVVYSANDFAISLSSDAMGEINGNIFTATDDETVTSGTITVAVIGSDLSIEVPVVFGKGSEVLFDFEDENSASDWKSLDLSCITSEISRVTAENGKVRFGNGALAVTTDYTQTNTKGGWIYSGLNTNCDDIIIPAEAISWGIWVYVPEEAVGGEIDFRPYHKVGDKYSRIDLVLFGNGYATTFDESGWHYVSVDISSLGELVIPGTTNSVIANGQSKAFIEIYNPDGANSDYSYGGYADYMSINGRFTYYLDDMTVDYSNAVDDREEPQFIDVYASYASIDEKVALNGQSIADNKFIFSAKAVENTVKSNYTGLDFDTAEAYIDGIDVSSKMTVGIDGTLTLGETTLADGIHTVKFAIKDKAGNATSIIRQINVQANSDIPTIKVVPKDNTLDKILIGSLYYMDIVATDIEKVNEVIVKIDINNSSEWQPEGIVVAKGFDVTCTVDAIDEIATIVITKNATVNTIGEAVLASIPARTWESTRHLFEATLTPEAIWASRTVWATDMQFTVKYGRLTLNDGTVSSFSAEKHKVATEIYMNRYNATAEYWNAKNTWHLHTAEAIADCEATCYANGYTGRTFCYVCNSVVDWGTVIPKTAHTYSANGNTLNCECGVSYVGTGLCEVDGNYYYFAAGSLVNGWVSIANEWYYFDSETYAAVESYNNGYVTFEFEENGKLVSGEWHKTSKGSRYYYGPTYYTGRNGADRWYEIDGNTYCFGVDGYCFTGIRFVDDSSEAIYKWYDFGTDGALVGVYNYTGAYRYNGILYYLVDGVSSYGMRYIDGAYYFFGAGGNFRAVTDVTRYCNVNNGLLPDGTYTFGADGKMLDEVFTTIDGVLYYYLLGNKATEIGTVEINGTEYTVDSTGKVLYTGNFTDMNGTEQYYENGVTKVLPKNGLIGDYFYIDDVRVGAYYGLVEFEGNFYYVNDGGKIIKNTRKYVNKTNGLTFPNGDPVPNDYFYFDESGKMIVKQGIADDTYYINGVSVKPFYGLVEWNGNYYYVDAEGTQAKIIKNTRKYVNKTNGLTFPDGTVIKAAYYEFDAEGKMIIKQGLIDDQYYVNGVALPAYYGLVEWNGDYYYINDYGKIIKNVRKFVNKTNGLTFPNGAEIPRDYFYFDESGKMIVKQGIADDTYYINGVSVKPFYGLVEWNGNYYYVDAEGTQAKIIKNTRKYVNKTNGLTFPDGTVIKAAYYEFDAEGKMIVKQGLVDDQFYVNGVALPAYYGLVEWNGDYYYLNDYGKPVKNERKFVNKTNGLTFPDGTAIPREYFYFDENGKMIFE